MSDYEKLSDILKRLEKNKFKPKGREPENKRGE